MQCILVALAAGLAMVAVVSLVVRDPFIVASFAVLLDGVSTSYGVALAGIEKERGLVASRFLGYCGAEPLCVAAYFVFELVVFMVLAVLVYKFTRSRSLATVPPAVGFVAAFTNLALLSSC